MTWTVGIPIVVLSFVFAILSGEMAREPGFAVMTAPLPLAPIVLLLTGDRKS
jgi:hypothetical protein